MGSLSGSRFWVAKMQVSNSRLSTEEGKFVDKLIMCLHNEIDHLGIANTMAAPRENWWIPRLRSKVKRIINGCNVCKVYRVKPYGRTATAELPNFRIELGPLTYNIAKKEEGKCYVLIFTCATSRVVHLELTKSQSAEEFRECATKEKQTVSKRRQRQDTSVGTRERDR